MKSQWCTAQYQLAIGRFRKAYDEAGNALFEVFEVLVGRERAGGCEVKTRTMVLGSCLTDMRDGMTAAGKALLSRRMTHLSLQHALITGGGSSPAVMRCQSMSHRFELFC